MNCWHCERPAFGVCKFCGRGLCKEHVKAMPYILDIYTKVGDSYKAVVVDNVLYCGVCNPKEEPVELKNL
ncbi:MAG: hypothetical protein V2A65_09185 [Candidatus Omnitrophota bacterium]